MKPILTLEEREYFFSLKSILFFLIGGPFFSFLLILFFSLEINNWSRELLTKQTAGILEHFFNMEIQVTFSNNEWGLIDQSIDISYDISLICTSYHIISIYVSFILLIPPSESQTARKDIKKRKLKSIILLTVIIYLGNLARLIMLIYLTNSGWDWNLTHTIINYGTGFLAAFLFIYVLYLWIPEAFISLYYIPLVLKSMKKIKEENI